MQKKQIFTLVALIMIFLGSYYISGIQSIVGLSFSLFIYSIFIYTLYSGYKKFKDKTYLFFSLENYNIFLHMFLYRVASLFIAVIVIIWGFSYYQNEISPAKMPVYTLTNGEKTIIFHGMSHIGTQNFYHQVQESIKKYKENGYVYYFEWVRPGTEANHEAFDKALWVKFDEKTYENMSKLYGLVNQNNQLFLWQVNDLDFNVDISIDDVMQKYEHIKSEAWLSSRNYTAPLDAWELIGNELSKLNSRELALLRYINKSFINMIVKSQWLQQSIQDNFSNKELFAVILDERNKVIADKIITSEDKKIIMTYWLLHFEWIFELLKQHDIKWRIERIDYLFPLK